MMNRPCVIPLEQLQQKRSQMDGLMARRVCIFYSWARRVNILNEAPRAQKQEAVELLNYYYYFAGAFLLLTRQTANSRGAKEWSSDN